MDRFGWFVIDFEVSVISLTTLSDFRELLISENPK
jgi:hypothetical protein